MTTSGIEIALRLEDVSKSYRAYATPADRLREALSITGKRFHRQIPALTDVSLTVPRGEVLGIVGHNGAGKSTLLKIVAGLIPPTSGRVERIGETSTLLDLGAGMNLEQSGLDNARFLAQLDNSTRNTVDSAAREAAIVEFADIGDMIDRPMKYYSHGMRARVAFAAATSIRPDLLIVDEVLAVGDSQFQRKCYARMEALMSEGTTVLFVSHDNQTIVEFCKRAVLLEDGRLVADGEPAAVVKDYLRKLDNRSNQPQESAAPLQPDQSDKETRSSTEHYVDPDLHVQGFAEVKNANIELKTITMTSDEGEQVNTITTGDRVSLQITYDCSESLQNVVLPISIKTKKGVELTGVRHPIDQTTLTLPNGLCTLQFEFACPLLQGDYFLSVGITQIDGDEKVVLYRGDDCFAFRVLPAPDLVRWGFCDLNAASTLTYEHQS